MSERVLLPQGSQGGLLEASVGKSLSRRSAVLALWQASVGQRETWRYVLGVGILWMLWGMVVMPSSISFNPSKTYQAILVLLMYLPALCLAFAQRGRLWRELWSLPQFRVFLALLAWATLSLVWAHLRRPGDELGRLLSVMTFILAWQLWDADGEDYVGMLLFIGGMGVAACAAFYCLLFAFHPDTSDRIAGEGIIATTNYAAALMGAVAIWMTQLRLRTRRMALLRWGSIVLLLTFVALTQTRGVWLALGVCLALAPLWHGIGWKPWAMAMAVMLLATAIALPMHLLTERGMSWRPELFMQSMHQIYSHPWLGQGQGAPIALLVGGVAYTHTHNLLTQVTMELGIPGLLLTVMMWLMVGWQGWRHRDSMRGRILLGLWLYASIVLQLDMPQLLDSPRPGWILIWLPFSLAIALGIRERAGRLALDITVETR
ncbi:O-antigen ligase family protein [Dyella sp.]|uniref:O-antigen ligase family protein n=1 Tax=Dyella sp. TaxID=1869338 RepID=UPI002ED23F09